MRNLKSNNPTAYTGNAFFDEIYSIVSQVPHGRVLSYGHIAKLAGKPQYSRMVGQAMRSAPDGLALPCHRVVNSQGRIAPNWPEQRYLLEREGIVFLNSGRVNMKRHTWEIIYEMDR